MELRLNTQKSGILPTGGKKPTNQTKKPEPLKFKLRGLSLVPALFGRFSSTSGGNIMCGS